MAEQMKPAGEDGAVEKKKKGGGRKAAKAAAGANGINGDELMEFFDRLHEVNDRLEEEAGAARSDMKAIYEEAADKFDIPKRVVKHLYALDRHDRKREKKERHKMEKEDRDSFRAIAAAFGEDTPLGAFAARAAENAGGARDA